MLKNISIYFFGSFISAGIPFLLLPILTRYLSPSEYGYITMFTLVLSITGVFTGVSVQGSIAREYFNKSINFKEFVFNCIIILFVSTFVVSLVFIFFVDYIGQLSSLPHNCIYSILIISFFQFIVMIILVLYQIQAKAKKYIFVQISQAIGLFSFSILFVVVFNMNWQGQVIAHIVVLSILGIISLKILFRDWIHFSFNIEYIKIALSFGIPLIPHSLGGILIVVVDRLIINSKLGIENVGIYTAGLQISRGIGLITSSVSRAYSPLLYEYINKNYYELNKKIIFFTYIYFISLLLLASMIGLFAPMIVDYILGDKFISSKNVIFWIALGEAFNGMYLVVVGYIFYNRKTIILTMITFSSGIICIFITYYFVELMGIEGAAIAYSISLFYTFLLTWIYAIKQHKMPWFERII